MFDEYNIGPSRDHGMVRVWKGCTDERLVKANVHVDFVGEVFPNLRDISRLAPIRVS